MKADTRTALADRAVALERAGRWTEADGAFSALFTLGVAERDPQALVDALRGNARARCLLRRHEEAAEMGELSLEIAERYGLEASAARAVNVVAWIDYNRQHWSGAEVRYREAIERARLVGDDELVGLTCQNLGVLANIRGDLREARVLYLESIAAAIRSGNEWTALMAYNNLGMVCSDLRESLEAVVYFDRGIELAERIGEALTLGKLLANRAEPLIDTGDLRMARETLARAGEAVRRITAPGVLADVERFRGLVHAAEGESEAAAAALSRSAGIAESAGLHLEQAEATRELARLYWADGRGDAARALITEAIELFRSVHAERDVELSRETLASWEASTVAM